MEIKEDVGGCFWMFLFAMLGLVTLPYGIAIWAVLLFIIIKILRTPND